MLTINGLKALGVNVDEGLGRCLGNEGFYLMLVGKILKDGNLEKLESALSEKDLDKAFEAAHAMKGTYGNLSLTPVYEPVCKITELLRNRADVDYSELLEEIKKQKAAIEALAK